MNVASPKPNIVDTTLLKCVWHVLCIAYLGKQTSGPYLPSSIRCPIVTPMAGIKIYYSDVLLTKVDAVYLTSSTADVSMHIFSGRMQLRPVCKAVVGITEHFWQLYIINCRAILNFSDTIFESPVIPLIFIRIDRKFIFWLKTC